MKYFEFTFTTRPSDEAVSDVLSMVLGEVGFESFVHTSELDLPRVGSVDNFPEAPIFADKAPEDTFKAYIQTALYDEDALRQAIEDFPIPGVTVTYEMAEAEDRDWNEEWEKNYFQPIIIGPAEHPRCVIAATFHRDVPDADYNVRINPQMSFGTGHHQTTAQMIGRLLDDEICGLEVLDMGCGTGVLGIMAAKCGAEVTAVDIDDKSVKNTLENAADNKVTIRAIEAATVPVAHYHLILANIHRNILIEQMPDYSACLQAGDELWLSGFYETDIPSLTAAAQAVGLRLVAERQDGDWRMLVFIK